MKLFILMVTGILMLSTNCKNEDGLDGLNNDELNLSLKRDGGSFIYTVTNNSKKDILFNKFSGSNAVFFMLKVFNNNGAEFGNDCSYVNYRAEDFLMNKKNYVLIKSGEEYSKKYCSMDCSDKSSKCEELYKNLPEGTYLAVIEYKFNKTLFKSLEDSKYFNQAWGGTLLSDTVQFEIK